MKKKFFYRHVFQLIEKSLCYGHFALVTDKLIIFILAKNT